MCRLCPCLQQVPDLLSWQREHRSAEQTSPPAACLAPPRRSPHSGRRPRSVADPLAGVCIPKDPRGCASSWDERNLLPRSREVLPSQRSVTGAPTPGSPRATGCHIGVTAARARLAAPGQGSPLKGLLINNQLQPQLRLLGKLKQTLWCWVNSFPFSQTRAPLPAAFTSFSAFHDVPFFQPTKQKPTRTSPKSNELVCFPSAMV